MGAVQLPGWKLGEGQVLPEVRGTGTQWGKQISILSLSEIRQLSFIIFCLYKHESTTIVIHQLGEIEDDQKRQICLTIC